MFRKVIAGIEKIGGYPHVFCRKEWPEGVIAFLGGNVEVIKVSRIPILDHKCHDAYVTIPDEVIELMDGVSQKAYAAYSTFRASHLIYLKGDNDRESYMYKPYTTNYLLISKKEMEKNILPDNYKLLSSPNFPEISKRLIFWLLTGKTQYNLYVEEDSFGRAKWNKLYDKMKEILKERG